MMMLMIQTKMTIMNVFFLLKDIIVVNFLSILSLRIMLDVAKVHGLHKQKMIKIYPSKIDDSIDHARINPKPYNQQNKCHLLIEHFWYVDVLRNDEASAFPEILCWSACVNYMEINTQHFSWTHGIR